VPRRSSFLHNNAAVRSDRRRGGRGPQALIGLTTVTVCAALLQGVVASAFAAPAATCQPPPFLQASPCRAETPGRQSGSSTTANRC